MNLTIKKDSIIYRDFIIANCLFAVALISIVIATLLEFIPIIVFEHKGFMINVLLGLSASSMISFICVYLPARSKHDSEIQDLTENCMSILMGYKIIINQLPMLCEPFILGFDVQTDLLLLKKIVQNKSYYLIEKIKTLTESYRCGEIESKELTLLIEKYNKGLCNNLETIIDYFNTIISIIKSNYTDKNKDIIKARYKRLMNGYVNSLLRVLEEDCPYKDLDKAFEGAFPQKKDIEFEYTRYLLEDFTQNASEASDNSEAMNKLLKQLKLYSIVQDEWIKDENQTSSNGDGSDTIKGEQ